MALYNGTPAGEVDFGPASVCMVQEMHHNEMERKFESLKKIQMPFPCIMYISYDRAEHAW